MKDNVLKYQHYLIVLAALLVANYITSPLWEYQKEQRAEIQLLDKQVSKIERLINNQALFDKQFTNVKENETAIAHYIFQENDEAKFKLQVRLALEKILTTAKCDVDRITWKYSAPINSSLKKWSLEARFKGNPACMITTTRLLGSYEPLMRVDDFSYRTRKLNGQVSNKISARLMLNIWQSSNNIDAEG